MAVATTGIDPQRLRPYLEEYIELSAAIDGLAWVKKNPPPKLPHVHRTIRLAVPDQTQEGHIDPHTRSSAQAYRGSSGKFYTVNIAAEAIFDGINARREAVRLYVLEHFGVELV